MALRVGVRGRHAVLHPIESCACEQTVCRYRTSYPAWTTLIGSRLSPGLPAMGTKLLAKRWCGRSGQTRIASRGRFSATAARRRMQRKRPARRSASNWRRLMTHRPSRRGHTVSSSPAPAITRETIAFDETAFGVTHDDPIERLDLESAIARLPESLRLVLELHYFIGLSSREVGKALGIPSATVRFRLSVARRRLRRLVTETVASSATPEVAS